MTTSTEEHEAANVLSANPFAVESPERLSPEQIVALFVPEFTDIETVRQRKHTFVWGSRGSGKSMMLRCLEPQCQAILHEGLSTAFEEPEPFLAVYCPCKEGQLNKTEFSVLDETARTIVGEHLISLTVAERLVKCLRDQFSEDLLDKGKMVVFANEVARLFDPPSISSSLHAVNDECRVNDEPLRWLHRLLALENRKLNTFLRTTCIGGGDATYDGTTSAYHDFVLPMMQLVKEFPLLKRVTVYLLLDDGDRLTRDQQRIINSWIANRDQSTLCIKVSAQRDGYDTFLTVRGGLIEQPHDYSEVDVEELYTRSKSDYSKKVRLIADKRLDLSPVPQADIATFLPANKTETDRLEQLKKETGEEWDRASGQSGEKPGRRSDYIYRYTMARLFQELRRKKRRKSYAGFQNLVHLSSGVVRDFLEPCYLMVDACIKKGSQLVTLKDVPVSIQEDVCYRYSEDFLDVKLQGIRKDLPPEQWTKLDSLRTLIESLGRLFYERLHDPVAREARLFSFTISGGVPRDLREILDLGVKHRYFQRRTYSTKEGGGREPWYILNRRLCPVFKLDPTGFEGRITLTPDLLRIACEDPNLFVRTRLGEPEDEGAQHTLPFDTKEEQP